MCSCEVKEKYLIYRSRDSISRAWKHPRFAFCLESVPLILVTCHWNQVELVTRIHKAASSVFSDRSLEAIYLLKLYLAIWQ